MPFLFADDTNLFISGRNSQKLYEAANNDLNAIAEWLKVNRLSLNVKKTHYMVFSNTKVKSDNAELKIEGETISEVSKTKFLGVIIDNRLNWQHHINYISCKVAKGIGIILKIRKVLDNESLRSLYYAFIYPYMMYCNHVWENACSFYLNKLIILQKKLFALWLALSQELPRLIYLITWISWRSMIWMYFWLPKCCIKFILQMF